IRVSSMRPLCNLHPTFGKAVHETLTGLERYQLSARRDLLARHILSKLAEPIRESPELRAGLKDLVASVNAARVRGTVAKRRDSQYGPSRRSGAWQKMGINKGQKFVIAVYTMARQLLML